MFDRMVIPLWKVSPAEGRFTWPARPLLASQRTADVLPLGQLLGDLQQQLGLGGRIAGNAFGPAAVRIRRDAGIRRPEEYRIRIRTGGIDIAAAADAGAYYAVQTLRDIVRMGARTLPCCTIDDRPFFERRGVSYDCSRGKVPTLDTLKQLVERLAHWKINELQLYIEHVFRFVRHPDIGKGHSPLTPDEILALQDHCKKHHVRLVGSLASFGHLEKILALPPYRHLGEMPGFRGLPGGTTLCPTDPGSIKLIAELYEEYIPLFEADDFNVCCDETWELGKGRSKTQADKAGVGAVYLDFLLKIHRLCRRYGKRTNAWADILLKHPDLLGKLPRDIVLLNWEYEAGGANIQRTRQIADAGLEFLVCPGTSGWLTHGSRLPNAMDNIDAFARQGRRCSARGLLNTDWGDRGHRNFLGVSLHGFAYGAACAWNPGGVDRRRFTENFCGLTFGQPAKPLAAAMTVLGSTYLTCGAPRRNGSYLFEALTEPMLLSKSAADAAIETMTAAGLEKVVEQLSSSALRSSLSAVLPGFERIALEELQLASAMDRLSAERALAAKTLRAGGAVKKTYLARLAGQIEALCGPFERLWLARNKPSRLCDNLRLFKKTHRQMLRLMKRL
ncbi:MAG: family 20 glycosylhydrolase [Planctomycetales bacterium]|nr:family 20 glycosylhydrolase [Planctomycetales bacterium]